MKKQKDYKKISEKKQDGLLAPKKSLGQNFLTSVGALDKIILAGELDKKSVVLEIGPGRGALTQKLLETGATILAIEKDSELIDFLNEKFIDEKKKKKFILIHGDILTVDIQKILGTKKYKLIANIPYYITGEIIRMFLEMKQKPDILVFLVQKEVAERIVAKDGKESVLSLSVKAYGVPKYIGTVSRGSFFPSPNVDSAIIQIIINKDNFKTTQDQEKYFTVIKTGFKAKRKKALSNLVPLFGKEGIEQVFTTLKLDFNIRPEAISCEQWIKISSCL